MCLCHPAAAPALGSVSQPDSPAVGARKAAARAGGGTKSLGESTKPPHHLVLSCVHNVVSFCESKQHNLTTASGSQTQRPFYLPQLCRASNTDISACTCPLSQALSEWVCCTSPLKLPKRETLTVSYTEGELRRLIFPPFLHFTP